jgi:hypothetical protein
MALMDLLPSKKEEPVAPPSHTGLLEVGGCIPQYWDTSDQVTVARARAQFERAIAAGYTAQAYMPGVVGFGGSRMDGEVTREFNPEADVVRMSLPYAGG